MNKPESMTEASSKAIAALTAWEVING